MQHVAMDKVERFENYIFISSLVKRRDALPSREVLRFSNQISTSGGEKQRVSPTISSGELSTATVRRRVILSSDGGHEIPAVLSLHLQLLFAEEKISNGRKSMVLIIRTI
ncbi:hypothetical protein ACLB2K_066828 [Fragaria x ananassa]